MATVRGTVATAVNSGGLDNQVLGGLIDARVKCMLDSYTLDGATDVVGTVIKLGGILPKGANVIAIVLKVTADQTSVTLDIGDAEDSDRYANDDTSLQSAGTYIIGCNNYVVDETDSDNLDNQIQLTVAGATMAAGTLYAAIFYSTD